MPRNNKKGNTACGKQPKSTEFKKNSSKVMRPQMRSTSALTTVTVNDGEPAEKDNQHKSNTTLVKRMTVKKENSV